MSYLAEIGKIESTFLGIEDHGMFALSVGFAFKGSGQAFGLYSLDFVADDGVSWANRLIKAILSAADVDQWERLKGRTLYVLRPEPYGLIRGLAPLPTENGRGFVFGSEPGTIEPYEVD